MSAPTQRGRGTARRAVEGAGLLWVGPTLLAPTGALSLATSPACGGGTGHHFSLKLARTSSLAARSSAVFASLSLSVRSAPRWRRNATVGASPSAAAIISAVRPRLSAA